MTSRDFCYWLQGYFEILNSTSERDAMEGNTLSTWQVECIRAHLNMVFYHEIDPGMGSKYHQEELTKIHQGGESVAQPPKSILEQFLGDNPLSVTDVDRSPKINC